MWAHLEGFAVPAAAGPVSAWPEAHFIGPVQSLGLQVVQSFAEQIVKTLVDRGEGAYTLELLKTLRWCVEFDFGEGAGKQLARIVPLVQRLTRGETQQLQALGKDQRLISAYLDGLPLAEPFYPVQDDSWCGTLAEHTAAILKELTREDDEELWEVPELWGIPHEENEQLRVTPQWRAINLVTRGVWAAAERFQKTRAVFATLRGVCPYKVGFARIPPHSEVQLHGDSTNFVLAGHLALEAEEGRCWLRVGEQKRDWRSGQVHVFDHTYPHAARNGSEHHMYLLLVYFYHPGVQDVERYALLLLVMLRDYLRRDEVFQFSSQQEDGLELMRQFKREGRPLSVKDGLIFH